MRQKRIWSSFVLLFLAGVVMAQITGKVEDEFGPMIGASVSVVGTNDMTETDGDGAFSIKGKVGDVLIITNPTTLNQKKFVVKKLKMGVLKMNEKVINLDVVVAFGKQKKGNLTGAISVIDSKAFENRPVTDAVQALQGQVAGMNFNMGAGGTELDQPMNFNIRGVGTIGNSASNPLVLIDGVQGDLSSINPQDIESISVLKDAAASSIYGSRAAFGVVLITTKSGKEGKVRINYNSNVSWSAPTVIPQSLDSETFAYYLNDALLNSGEKPRFNESWINEIIDYQKGILKQNMKWNNNNNNWYTTRAWANTDWSDVFYRSWSPSEEHNLSVSGGTKSIRYYISANYLGKEGLLRFNTDTYDRYTFNGKFSADLYKWLNVEYNTRFTRRDLGKPIYANGGSEQFYQTILKKWPVMPAKDPFGHYIVESDVPKLEMGRRSSEEDILTQSLNLKLEPIKNWVTHLKFTYRTNQRNEKKYINPIYTYDEDNNPFPVSPDYRDRDFAPGGEVIKTAGFSAVYDQAKKSKLFSPNIFSEYTKEIGLHNIKGLIGFQSELYREEKFSASRDGLSVVGKEWLDLTQGKQVYVNGGAGEWSTLGVFSRINYNYDEKYLVELNLRYDGASRFLGDLRWAWYPSVSLGWNVAREKFWENLGGFFEKFNTFKLRASYGSLGNQTTRDFYPYYPKLTVISNTGSWLINGQPTNEAFQPALISENLTWEKVSTANIGLDISAFRNRLDFSLDVFERKTDDMVGPAPTLPGILGIKEPEVNNTNLVSRGFELVLGWNDRIGKDFKYSIHGTLTDSRQKVTRYPNKLKSLNQDYYPGEYLGEIWGFTTHGIAKTNEEMQEWLTGHKQDRLGSRWAAGDIMYEDLNGDGIVDIGTYTVDNPGDLSIIGNNTPRFNFGLDLSMEYKGVDVRFFFQGVGQRQLSLEGPLFQGFSMPSYWNSTAVVQHLDYFRPADTHSPFGPNLDAYFPRTQYKYGTKNYYSQTRFLQDGAYIRLKNLQVGYTLPKKLTKKIGVSKMRIYFSGENLLTLTKLMEIFDPEAVDAHIANQINGSKSSGSMYPMSKVISTGINLTF